MISSKSCTSSPQVLDVQTAQQIKSANRATLRLAERDVQLLAQCNVHNTITELEMMGGQGPAWQLGGPIHWPATRDNRA